MNLIPPGRWTRPLAAALLALLVTGWVASGKAQAGCSHASASQAHFEVLVEVGALSDLPTSTAPRKPCNGPMCSKAPAVPPASASVSIVAEPWAILAASPSVLPKKSSPLPIPPPRVTCKPSGPAIFHPPR